MRAERQGRYPVRLQHYRGGGKSQSESFLRINSPRCPLMDNPQKRLVVIGGGAAGLFCAVNAARLNPSLAVVVVEKTGKLLSKGKVSGGGRCNVTHACYEISAMVKKYPRGGNFVKKAFHRFFTTDTIAWFEDR